MDTAGTDRGIVPIIGEDGVIRTDGSTILGADDKSGIAGCLELVRLLRDHPEVKHPTIEFVVTVGEESGLVGSRHLDVGRLNATHGFVLDTAGAMGSVTYWSPTSVYFTITVRGRKATPGSSRRRASVPSRWRPRDRLDAAGQDRRGDLRRHRHRHRREVRNVVPDLVVLEGMARSHGQAELDAHSTRCAGRARRPPGRPEPPWRSRPRRSRTYRIPEDARPYREAAAAIRSLGLEVVHRASPGAALTATTSTPRASPAWRCPQGMVDEHATSEHIAIDDLAWCWPVAPSSRSSPSQPRRSPDDPTDRGTHRRRPGRRSPPRGVGRSPPTRTCSPSTPT